MFETIFNIAPLNGYHFHYLLLMFSSELTATFYESNKLNFGTQCVHLEVKGLNSSDC
jgi:hypothetical protein